MKILVCLLTVLLLAGTVYGQNQLMFIYADDKPHDSPADLASVPIVNRITGQTAYAGATWIKLAEQTPLRADGRLNKSYAYRWADKVYPARNFYVMSSFKHCIAWDVRPSDEFGEFLEDNGYRRAEVKDAEVEIKEILR